MGKKRLFKLTVVYFVAADSSLEAVNVAPTMKASDVYVEEVERLEEVPEGWHLAYPMGDSSKLCRDFFKA